VLVWAREHGCPWSQEYICAWAADGGHMAVLRWARANGCPWDGRTYVKMLEDEAAAAAAAAGDEAAAVAAAAAEAVAEAAEAAEDPGPLDPTTWRVITASMAVAVAVEAYCTWHSSSYTGFVFLLILCGRPLLLVLFDSLLIYFVFSLGLLLVDPPPAMLGAPWEDRFVMFLVGFTLIALLLRLVIFQASLRILILLLCRVWSIDS